MIAGDGFHLVLCTCPDAKVAARIGEALVDKRLAACVTLVPQLTSIYRWQGQIHQDAEVLLLIKTDAAHLDSLEETLHRLHPYEVPEIIALPIVAGSKSYLEWIDEETKQPVTSDQ